VTLKYLSVCSGIDAASVAWQALGWHAVGFSEIEKFPCAVLAHHYPEVPNFGDMTKYEEWPIKPGSVDVLIGGTPCQSFSVAGLRKGLADPRGNLALVYLALADRIRPRYVVWENVPGVLSDKTKVVATMLDAFAELGYVSDIDILDARFFGVAQRRRRVFICAQSVEHLLKARTSSSALTICQCLAEICQMLLAGRFNQSENAQVNSESQENLRDGLLKRMKLFGLLGENTPIYGMWQSNLAEIFQMYHTERGPLEYQNGGCDPAFILEGQSSALVKVRRSLPTAKSWQTLSGEFLALAKSYTTSTSTSKTTTNQIFTCFQTVLATAKLIVLLNPSSPRWSGAESSTLTSLKEFIRYARQANSDLFGELQWDDGWDDAVCEAEYLCEIIRDIGDRQRAASVLFERESGTRNTPARRKAGEGVTSGLDGAPGIPCEQPFKVANCLTRRMHKGINTTIDEGQTPVLACFEPGAASRLGGYCWEDLAPTLRKEPGDNQPAVAYSVRTAFTGANGIGVQSEISHTVDCASPNAVASIFGVRRLTPTECERLQGFSDGYTKITESTPDGLRYKALGNSMAVPVIRWIGEKIQAVDSI